MWPLAGYPDRFISVQSLENKGVLVLVRRDKKTDEVRKINKNVWEEVFSREMIELIGNAIKLEDAVCLGRISSLSTLAVKLGMFKHVTCIISLGSVGGRKATICLSGSTLILKDVFKIGDIDFCEYIPNEVPTPALAEAIETQVRQNDLRQCAVSVRMRTGSGGNDELSFYSVTPQAAFTPEQLEKVRELLTRTKNGQTFHLLNTTFCGITEATNWLILFQPPLEDDPVSGLSFAHQEASLAIFGRRRLHAIEALAAYMSFLRAEINTYAPTNPVKAFKRAVSWLRMFGNNELLVELKELIKRHRATEAASTLSKMEIWEKYNRMQNLNEPLRQLVADLKGEIDASVKNLVGQPADSVGALRQLITQFGVESYMTGSAAMPQLSLWERILSLAER